MNTSSTYLGSTVNLMFDLLNLELNLLWDFQLKLRLDFELNLVLDLDVLHEKKNSMFTSFAASIFYTW